MTMEVLERIILTSLHSLLSNLPCKLTINLLDAANATHNTIQGADTVLLQLTRRLNVSVITTN